MAKKNYVLDTSVYLTDANSIFEFGNNDIFIPLKVLEEIDNHKYSIEESEIGYKNFCVIETFIKSIEWLYLAAKGHRRAYFSLKNNSLEKKWLIP